MTVPHAEGVGQSHDVDSSAQGLLAQLRTEYKQHMAQLEKERHQILENRRRFSRQDVTAQLLIKACEKLLQDKAALEECRYEEHTADLHVLYQQIGVGSGTAKRAEKALSGMLGAQLYHHLSGLHNRMKRSSFRALFGSCINDAGGFPYNRSWWTDAQAFFNHRFQVLRNEEFVSSAAAELVAGDILYLEMGLRAPCDLRVLKTAEATLVDTPVDSTGSETRVCTADCTSADLKASNNIILKGSWVLQGSLLAIAIRSPTEPLAPHCSGIQEDAEFFLDMNLPSGLSETFCQTTFSSLCVRASCVCRSFRSMMDLAVVQTVIVYLTEDLRKDPSATSDLVRDLTGLGKAVFLLVQQHEQGLASSLAEECKLKFVDFETGSKQTPSTGVSSASASHFDLSIEGHDVMTASSRRGHDDDRVAELVACCTGETTPGAVVHGISEAELVQFCTMLREADLNPLYASSHLQPQFLRALSEPGSRLQAPPSAATTTPRGRSASDDTLTQVKHFPSKASQELSSPHLAGQNVTPVTSKASQPSRTPKKSGGDQVPGAASVSAGDRHGLQDAYAHIIQNGQVPLQSTSKAPSVVVVSVNARGVLADCAHCALLRPDLRCLAKALQTLTKAVPKVA